MITSRLEATCPYCKQHEGCAEASPRGFMERTVLRALGFRAFSCKACGNHRTVYTGQLKGTGKAEEPAAAAAAVFPSTRSPSSRPDFARLIAEMRQREESIDERGEHTPLEQRLPYPRKRGGTAP